MRCVCTFICINQTHTPFKGNEKKYLRNVCRRRVGATRVMVTDKASSFSRQIWDGSFFEVFSVARLERATEMVNQVAAKGFRGQSDRAKTSMSVRLDDRKGFDHKFNKTGFKCEKKRHLYYYYVKCYEQVLRGNEASSVLAKRACSKYRRLAETNCLKPLPEGFGDFEEPKKIETLSKLIEEQLDAGVGIVEQCEDVGIQVSRSGKMEVDEDSSADLGPEYSINEMSSLDVDCVQSAARNFQGNPQGRPPTCHGLTGKIQQFVSGFKRRASGYSDILMEVQRWEQQGMEIVRKLEDRVICESLRAGNTLIRSRQEEILSELQQDIMVKDSPNQYRNPLTEGAGLQASYSQASYSQASDFGEDVERGVENFEQDPAVDPLSTASSFIVRPDHIISEALKATPSYTGRLKANLEEIHPRVAGDLQYNFSKPMMEGVGSQVSYPQASDLWSQKQYGGEYLTTMQHSGGNNVPQMIPMGYSVSTEPSNLERTTPESWAEKPGSDDGDMKPMMEVSHPQASDLWGHIQYSGTMQHSGGNSDSQIIPMGYSTEPFNLERTTPERWPEKPCSEPAFEGSPSPPWMNLWSPVRNQF
ncbi:hypothetical protein M758_10G102300 [Ceratodon purpureus]|nr:hypothetical protein M758_10G102300 [Ceratodon purpureus]